MVCGVLGGGRCGSTRKTPHCNVIQFHRNCKVKSHFFTEIPPLR